MVSKKRVKELVKQDRFTKEELDELREFIENTPNTGSTWFNIIKYVVLAIITFISGNLMASCSIFHI